MLAGLCEQTSGEVSITPSSISPTAAPPLSLEARMAKVTAVQVLFAFGAVRGKYNARGCYITYRVFGLK